MAKGENVDPCASGVSDAKMGGVATFHSMWRAGDLPEPLGRQARGEDGDPLAESRLQPLENTRIQGQRNQGRLCNPQQKRKANTHTHTHPVPLARLPVCARPIIDILARFKTLGCPIPDAYHLQFS